MKSTFFKEFPPTLLRDFISQRLDQYVEPSRAGTPRGEPIGFTKAKYAATLCGLCDMKQKDIASALGVSHGLLRKWHTEDAFLKMIDNHCESFVRVFIANVHNRAKRLNDLSESFWSKPLNDFAVEQQPPLPADELSDMAVYSFALRVMLGSALVKETEIVSKADPPDLSVLTQLLEVMDGLLLVWNRNNLGNIVAQRKWLAKELLKPALQAGINTILKPEITEDEKKLVINALKQAAKLIE